eukprot:8367085-Ditylum_brightwellii.AAC.1
MTENLDQKLNSTKANIKNLVKDIMHKELKAIIPEFIQTILEQVKSVKTQMLKCVNNIQTTHDMNKSGKLDAEYSKSDNSLDKEEDETGEDLLPITQDNNKESENLMKSLLKTKNLHKM